MTPNSELVTTTRLPMDRHPAFVYLAGLANDRARRVQHNALEVVAEIMTNSKDILTMNWQAVRFQHVALVRSVLAEKYAASSANRMLSALRGTLKAAWRLGYIDAETYHQATDVEKVRGETVPAGRDLSPGEILALMTVCMQDESPAGPRDAAIFGIMYLWGLRRAEIVNLDLEHYDVDSGRLLVKGKGNKRRIAYLENGDKDALEDWLHIRGDEPGPLFWPINRGGNTYNRRMADQAVWNLCKKRGDEAGVRDFSPHDLRRTCAGDYLDAGVDLVIVSKILGHASPQTTAKYDRRPEEQKREAARKLHVPYIKRQEHE